MKKIAFLLLILFSVLSVRLSYASDEDEYHLTANDKFTRGAVNISTFYLELPVTVFNTCVEENPVTGLLYGPVLGFAKSGLRLVTGVVEILTFPFPPYEPMMEPEFLLFERKKIE